MVSEKVDNIIMTGCICDECNSEVSFRYISPLKYPTHKVCFSCRYLYKTYDIKLLCNDCEAIALENYEEGKFTFKKDKKNNYGLCNICKKNTLYEIDGM